MRSLMEFDGFLSEVYSLCAIGESDVARNRISGRMDYLLSENSFSYCDAILFQVDPRRLSSGVMRHFLSCTEWVKLRLPSRAALYYRIRERMILLRGEEKTDKIIGNLK